MTDLRVAFLGDGHINGALLRAVQDSRPYRVLGTYGRDDALPASGAIDVVIEAATQQAVRERVPALLDGGVDVILLSVGALADPAVRSDLLTPRPGRGRLLPCTGAIGGLDQVRALRAAGPLRIVSLESRKLPTTLIQPWMPEQLQLALRAGDTEIVLADGPAGEVAQRFPASANVAAALALAADGWDIATARIVADPAAVQTRHEIRAVGDLGEVRTIVTNAPSPERPRSSAVVAWAALRALDDYARLRGFPDAGGVTFL
ncbi:aspartate dehydrogenase [Microbacterium sp. W4I4]|uniref:aspartate dehydrogenase domain-containing protein n=1 Tax=Microbacterium sp. W4I4 TaxID=3042295 RepID=UPI00278ABEED|nr:aspartate dehydrogenase domain-containing protein [Microbacterium sp. W4I4]MDQ0614790.1 aspartate dehydrogenase [Microbacterium sp. W4I4]